MAVFIPVFGHLMPACFNARQRFTEYWLLSSVREPRRMERSGLILRIDNTGPKGG
jgi:hypothetical protein